MHPLVLVGLGVGVGEGLGLGSAEVGTTPDMTDFLVCKTSI